MSYRVTERDGYMLHLIAAYPGQTVTQLHARMSVHWPGSPLTYLHKRIRHYESDGLLQRHSLLSTRTSLVCVTRKGLAYLGVGGATPRPRMAQLRHDLALVDLGTMAATRWPQFTQYTETQLRRMPTDRQQKLCTPQVGGGGIYYPDLVLADEVSGSRAIVELETSRKNTARLFLIMRSHLLASMHGVIGVRYYADARTYEHVASVAETATRYAVEQGLPVQKIHVAKWEVWGDGSATPTNN